jgi:putative endonuclease
LFLICSGEILSRPGEGRDPEPLASDFARGSAASMNEARSYSVYILASGMHGTLYIGVTNNLRTRLEQHRAGQGSEFVKKYGVRRLVHVEEFASPQEAIAREKQLKNWQRDWKIKLIQQDNPDWSDLSHLL